MGSPVGQSLKTDTRQYFKYDEFKVLRSVMTLLNSSEQYEFGDINRT